MKQILVIVTVLFFFNSCKKDVIEDEKLYPTFVTRLNPVDDENVSYNISLNVIQGIANFDNGWFTTQKSGERLLINYLDKNGTSLFHKRMYLNSHGQDLSLEIISDTLLYLYTSKGSFGEIRNSGMYKLKVKIPKNKDYSLLDISLENEYDLKYYNSTPTLNEEKTKFAIRSNKTILVHNKSTLEDSVFQALYHFEINNAQQYDNLQYHMWFQGIAMQDNEVFCLTGNERLDTEKKIFKYNDKGIKLKEYIIDSTSIKQPIYGKLEPEGLAIIKNELFFTIMTKSINEEGNVKYLYKIKL